MSESDSESFRSYFKIPRRQINEIRKEYQTATEALEKQKVKIDPEKFKNFTALGNELFDFFEEITGKKVNRETMRAHTNYWLDEGYDLEDFKAHISKQLQNSFYSEHPELFTIARLFPIQGQEAINSVWDHLAFHQSLRTAVNEDLMGAFVLELECGHHVLRAKYQANPYCAECVLNGNLWEIARNPYAEEVPKELLQFASQFKRQPDETTLSQYQARTQVLFDEIYRRTMSKTVDNCI